VAHKETFTLPMICSLCQKRVRKPMVFVVSPHPDMKGYAVAHEACWMAHQEPVRDMTGEAFRDS
jgi:hypothetical protein